MIAVPLRMGGGTRLKIVEAMVSRLPVVSTSVGAQGLEVRHGQHVLLGDAPDAFAQRSVQLLEDGLCGASWPRTPTILHAGVTAGGRSVNSTPDSVAASPTSPGTRATCSRRRVHAYRRGAGNPRIRTNSSRRELLSQRGLKANQPRTHRTITPNWLRCGGPQGARRLSDPGPV